MPGGATGFPSRSIGYHCSAGVTHSAKRSWSIPYFRMGYFKYSLGKAMALFPGALQLRRHDVVVVVLVVVSGDFAPRGHPNAVMAGDVLERLCEGADTMRLTDQERVHRDAHYGPVPCSFLIELVELGLDGFGVLARRSCGDLVE